VSLGYFFQADDGIRDCHVTGVQTCALPIFGTTPFLGLPGNPVSVFITFLLLARPYLARLQGRTLGQPPEFALPAGFEHARPDSRRQEYLRARIRNGSVEIHSRPSSGDRKSVV